ELPTERIAHDTAAGGCCTAEFCPGLCPLWVNSVRDNRDNAAAHVRFVPKADKILRAFLGLLCASGRRRPHGAGRFQHRTHRACGSSSNSARLFQLQARFSDDPFGGLALVANEARELLQCDPRRLDGTIDVHSLPEVALIDDARNLMRES